jgi:hypothetical protein
VDITCHLSDETRKAKKMLKLSDGENEPTETYVFARVDHGKFEFKSSIILSYQWQSNIYTSC